VAYVVKRVISNGYRCSCCYSDWEEDDEWVEDFDKAVSYIPIDEFPPPIFDSDLVEIKIVDGATGEDVAVGNTTWPKDMGKYGGNNMTVWSGHVRGEQF